MVTIRNPDEESLERESLLILTIGNFAARKCTFSPVTVKTCEELSRKISGTELT